MKRMFLKGPEMSNRYLETADPKMRCIPTWSGRGHQIAFHLEFQKKLRAAPPQEQPDMDWSADKPEDSWHKVDEPHNDWAGARPEGPFDRPSVTTATETNDDVELAPVPESDMSEYEEEDDDKPPPVTGVLCAAWTMLALGAVAGAAAAATGPAAVMPQLSPDAPAFFAQNPNQPTATDASFPEPNTLVPCANDPSCNVVMDSLGPLCPSWDNGAVRCSRNMSIQSSWLASN